MRTEQSDRGRDFCLYESLPLAGRAHFPFLPKTEYVINPASVGAGRTVEQS